MPKTKDAFALRGFDVEEFIKSKLAECGLQPDALTDLGFFAKKKDSADDLARFRKIFFAFRDIISKFRRKIIRHHARLENLQKFFVGRVALLDADDEVYFEVYKPLTKRILGLSEEYMNIAKKIINAENLADDAISFLNAWIKTHYTRIFSKRLREARKSAGLTQAELAAQIGLQRTTYAFYEQGRNEPNVSLAAMFAKELKISADWLLGLT